MSKAITCSPEETIEYAKAVGQRLRGGDVVAFIGGLGAGKTTFTRGLAVGLGLEDDVSSPTFSLVNEYRGKLTLYHFDMYRITSSDELETTGFFDYMNNESVIVVEWSENISDWLPDETIFITLKILDENTRGIEIQGGDRF